MAIMPLTGMRSGHGGEEAADKVEADARHEVEVHPAAGLPPPGHRRRCCASRALVRIAAETTR